MNLMIIFGNDRVNLKRFQAGRYLSEVSSDGNVGGQQYFFSSYIQPWAEGFDLA